MPAAEGTITIRPHGPVGFGTIANVLLKKYPKRTVLGLAMIMRASSWYNGVAFTFAMILAKFYGVKADRIGLYLLPFALGNFLGPLCWGGSLPLGAKADDCRYVRSLRLAAGCNGFPVRAGVLTGTTQTVAWGITFFLPRAASLAYLTVSEIFPLERGLAIALFYSTGTALGGPMSSWLFGCLIDKGAADFILTATCCAAILVGTVIVVPELRRQRRADVARAGR